MGEHSIFTSRRGLCFAIMTLTNCGLLYFTTNHSISSNGNLSFVLFRWLRGLSNYLYVFEFKQIKVGNLIVRGNALYVRTSCFTSHAGSQISARRPFLSREENRRRLARIFYRCPGDFFVDLLLTRYNGLNFGNEFRRTLMNVNRNLFRLIYAFIINPCRRPLRTFITRVFVFQGGNCFRSAFQFSPTGDRRTIKEAFFRKLARVGVITMLNQDLFYFFSFSRF